MRVKVMRVVPWGMTLLHGALTDSVIAAFYQVYNHLGPGFLESLYTLALERELRARGHRIGREVAVPVYYRGELLGRHRLDLIVDDVLVVEVKAVDRVHPAVFRQLRGYLRSTRLELGLILNFGPRPQFERVLYTNDRK